MPVTFTARRINAHVDDYRCNETGVHYQIRRTADGFVIQNSGNAVAHRTERDLAVNYIEQQAALDFLTAQSDSAYAGSC
jgi:hypothetical protein